MLHLVASVFTSKISPAASSFYSLVSYQVAGQVRQLLLVAYLVDYGSRILLLFRRELRSSRFLLTLRRLAFRAELPVPRRVFMRPIEYGPFEKAIVQPYLLRAVTAKLRIGGFPIT